MDFVFDPSLVLYLPLYQLDGASFVSKDARGHLCTVTGALWRPNGHYFDGTDDYIECPFPASLVGNKAFTVELWLKATRISHTSSQTFFSMGTSNANEAFLIEVTTPNTDWNSVGFWGNGKDTNVEVLTNNYEHIVATYDLATVIFYQNTTPTDIGFAGATPNLTAGVVRLCRQLPAFGNYAQAIIPELRIYNRALTPQEIQHNYLATKWRYR